MFFDKYKDFIKKQTLKYSTAVFINKDAIIHNFEKIKSCVGDKTKVISVIKNDAYKLGIKDIAPILATQNNEFYVATLDEAIELRKLDSNYIIYVLHGTINNRLNEFKENNLIPVLSTINQVLLWHDYTSKGLNNYKCVLHVETGINRLGLSEKDIQYIVNNNLLQNTIIEYVISHFACSDIKNHISIDKQYNKFIKLSNYFPLVKKSLCASCSIYLNNEYHFDAVRPGIALYGANPLPYDKSKNIMENVLYIYTTILQIKTIKNGECIGYGHLWKAERDSKIAVLSIGFADGISKNAYKSGYVFINQNKAPIVGAISMDLLTVDITDIPIDNINENTIIEIIGDNITIDQYANTNKVNLADILNSMTKRYPKYFI